MLRDQFFLRIILIIAVGIVYVKAYMNMAVRNSKEREPERHLVLKILGGFLAFLAIAMGVSSINTIPQITYPNEVIGPFINPNMIVRPSSQPMYWGHTTMDQSMCLFQISAAFEFLALSAYCFLYKNSHSKWYSKVGKIIFCILFYSFFVNFTDFHYFDIYEFTSPLLFSIMAYFALRNKEKVEPVIVSVENTLQQEETVVSNTTAEDNSRFMPVGADIFQQDVQINDNADVNPNKITSSTDKVETSETPEVIDRIKNNHIQNNIHNNNETLVNANMDTRLSFENDTTADNNSSSINKEENKNRKLVTEPEIESAKDPELSVDSVIKFCRHCGSKIDYKYERYCKHCGKQLF